MFYIDCCEALCYLDYSDNYLKKYFKMEMSTRSTIERNKIVGGGEIPSSKKKTMRGPEGAATIMYIFFYT